MKPVFAVPVLMSLLVVNAIAAPASRPKAAEQRISITVTSKGFEPETVPVKAGRPVVLVVTRKTDRTCAKDLVIASRKVRQPLPLNQPVEIRLASEKPGSIRFACGMDMIAGTLVVK